MDQDMLIQLVNRGLITFEQCVELSDQAGFPEKEDMEILNKLIENE